MTPAASVAALAAMVTPPEVPTRPTEVEWTDFARGNGFEAPVDFRLMIERFGVGGFGTASLPGGWALGLECISHLLASDDLAVSILVAPHGHDQDIAPESAIDEARKLDSTDVTCDVGGVTSFRSAC